ncbi:MAG: 4Fe-4S dicluster domain-containing protein [Planctomycetes bacterium]|nr:4Fe-4S dicluster domain-containing protein [Planctomycetota bacterium]
MAEREAIVPREVIERSFAKKGAKQLTLWIDLETCVGCNACTLACKSENNTPVGVDYNRVIEIEEGEFRDPKSRPEVNVYFVPMPCMHCGRPACLAACPVGAITKREEDGVVLINKDRCIGCRYCAWACPYGAPQFNAEDKVMEKCTLCVHRLEKGLLPACVTTCIARTRYFGELNELTMLIREKRARRVSLGSGATDPSLQYSGPK